MAGVTGLSGVLLTLLSTNVSGLLMYVGLARQCCHQLLLAIESRVTYGFRGTMQCGIGYTKRVTGAPKNRVVDLEFALFLISPY